LPKNLFKHVDKVRIRVETSEESLKMFLHKRYFFHYLPLSACFSSGKYLEKRTRKFPPYVLRKLFWV